VILEKAPDAFRTISEVADEIDVPQHVLRFWESRFSHIRPMKRGGGRRYYRPDDVDLLRGIRHLLYGEGYTIRGVQRILREHGGAFVQNVWRVGAEPPPPPLEEDAQEVAPEPAENRAEPTLFSGLGESGLGETVRSAEDSIGRGEYRRKLELALDELLACRRIIDGVLQQG
jgi:DNA-binding transcriptional MerR regulator